MNTVAVTFADMKAEGRRELALRGRVYRKWVEAGTMTEADAARHTARLTAIVELLDELDGSRSELPQSLFRLRTVEVQP